MSGNVGKVRIKLKSVTKKKSIISLIDSNKQVTQGNTYTFYLVVTNTGSIPTGPFEITEFLAENSAAGLAKKVGKKFLVKSLNPSESYDVLIDTFTFEIKGDYWVNVKLNPLQDNQDIRTFQFDENHDEDSEYPKLNQWGMHLCVDGRLELYQQRTNTLILILTAITLVEAIWKVDKVIQLMCNLIAEIYKAVINVLF